MKKHAVILLLILSGNLFAQTPNTLTDNDKIYILSEVWSEVKRNFVFYDRIDFDWDSTYVSTLDKISETDGDYEFHRLMQEFVAKLKDGHTNYYMPNNYNKYLRGIPIRTRMIENKVIITQVNNDILRDQGIKVGMEVVKINDLNAQDYASKYVAPYISASTKQDSISRVYDYQLFRGLRDKKIKLDLKTPEGESRELVVDRNMKWKGSRTQNMSFELLENNSGLLKINTFFANDFKEEFDSVFQKALHAKKLIIDIRNNGGGNSGNSYYVLQHLTNKQFINSSWRTRKYMPAFISWKYEEEWHAEGADTIEIKKGEKFENPVVLLTSVRTFSAAEDFSVAFKQMKRGEIIGQPTGGSTGNPIGFQFKDESFVRICTKEDMFANGDKFIGVGIKPDIYIKPTIKDFRNNRDMEIEKALEVLKTK